MGRKKKSIDVDYTIKSYIGGVSISQLVDKLSTCDTVIKRVLVENGIRVRTEREAKILRWKQTKRAATPEMISQYISGVSMNVIAKQHGISRGGINAKGQATGLHRMLLDAGVTLRSQSQAESVKWRRMDDKTRGLQVRKAHLAKCSPVEIAFMEAMRILGQSVIHQFPIGKYNVDFALQGFSIAVEIQRVWPLRREDAIPQSQRIEQILNSGFHVLMVVGKLTNPDAVAQQVIAFANQIGTSKPQVGSYWMISGNNQSSPRTCMYFNHLTRINRPCDALNIS